MANWGTNLNIQHQILVEAMFNARFIECKAEFSFVPSLYKWCCFFKTKFKYLSLNELVDFEPNFFRTYNGFVLFIEESRTAISKEYNNYFNELWC